jgi:hypothetical protein
VLRDQGELRGGDRRSNRRDAGLLQQWGISEDDSRRWQRLATLTPEDLDAYFAERRAAAAEFARTDLLTRVGMLLGEGRRRGRIAEDARTLRAGCATMRAQDAVEWLMALEPEADLLLTDPPYSTDVADVEAFAAEWIPAALGALRESGRAYIVIGAYPDEVGAYWSVLQRCRPWRCVDLLVWTFRNTLGPDGAGHMPNWHAILHVTRRRRRRPCSRR